MPRDDPDISPDLLLHAYAAGVFPMAETRSDPDLFWVDPRRRGVIPLDGFHISRSLARAIRRGDYRVSIDRDFAGVVDGCADREETWISERIRTLYMSLFDLNRAHSLEVWDESWTHLIGGVYGVTLGRAFFGESMFSAQSNASKFCFIKLVEWAKANGYGPIDCQISNNHLTSLGAEIIPREAYTKLLRTYLAAGKTRRGKWTIHK